MAAAVADRTDVAQRLLQAAGPSVAPMVAATNGYGQVSDTLILPHMLVCCCWLPPIHDNV